MNRRGQGLSINLIILVAIGLIILVIAILLVNRSGKTLSENAGNDCVTKGGVCQTESCTTKPGYEEVQGITCPDTKSQQPQYCCRYDFG